MHRHERHRGRLCRLTVALVSVLVLLLSPVHARAQSVPGTIGTPGSVGQSIRGPLYFPETSFAIDEPKFVDYFLHRGRVATFGYPISRTVQFQGLTTQFFQRIVVQLAPDGGVRPLNLLDPGLLPYTQINGSTFPAPNERLSALAPVPDHPGYDRDVLEFVRANAVETFNGQPVRFFSTFSATVTADDAFPDGRGDPRLLPLINLEIWGLPTSLPTLDPNNGNFIYQRFQRGIMHYDAACRCTQGLLLADYFKSVLTGDNLPPDLAVQAADSPFLRQYQPGGQRGLRRAAILGGTDLTDAFARQQAPAVAVSVPMVSASAASTSAGAGTSAAAGHARPDGSLRSRMRLDPEIVPAVDALEGTGTVGPLAAIVDSDTQVLFGPLRDRYDREAAVHARYSNQGGDRTIVVNERWQNSDPKAIAALIVHEGKHLQDDLAGGAPRTADQCIGFEARAFIQQSLVWQTFYGPKGKARPQDDLDAELNDWLAAYQRGPADVERRVRQYYTQDCSRYVGRR
ncbi:MAG: hypothetical protein IT305_17835 [Chloroflexi bacterium]|nr:hypothetical protein [Chloroflexota bacterium]